MPTAANRHDYPNHADVWSLRRNWVNEKARIKLALLAGRFRFGLLDRIPHAHINNNTQPVHARLVKIDDCGR